MSKLSLCIMAYGLVLISAHLADTSLSLQLDLPRLLVVPCWATGIFLIAAGLAASQRRTALRRTGTWLGILVPLVLGCLFGWQVMEGVHLERRTTLMLTGLAIVSFAEVALALKIRPREGIASRGYAVSISPPKNNPNNPAPVKQPARRSEAG